MKIQNRCVLLRNFGLAHLSLSMFAFLGQHLEPSYEELQRGTRRGIWKGQKGNTQKYMIVLLFPHHSLHWCQVLAYMQYIYWWQKESPMGKTQVTRPATRRVTTSTYEQDQHQKCSTTTPLRQQGKPMGKTTYKTQVTRPATRRVTNHKWRSQRPQTAPPNSSHKVSSHPLFFKAIIFFDHILAVSSSQQLL